jgi:AraC-like DNA-binding protein
MNVERHLILQTVVLPPSAEWSPPVQDWVVMRVGEGVGYWMQGGNVRELKEGDGFVASGYRNLIVRASQLGSMKLELFFIQTPLLNGLLTVTEGNRLDQVAHSVNGQMIFFTATESLGQKFSRLVHQSRPESLPSRAALFQFWSQAVSGLITQPVVDESGHKLRQRFRQLVAQMPDAELARQSLTRLAGMLECSERHFSRLFRQEFGVSLRARQAELRLQRARQLLADPKDKISNIAFESGYRHLGLFNAMFKKRFGLTPREWRRQNLSAPENEAAAAAGVPGETAGPAEGGASQP